MKWRMTDEGLQMLILFLSCDLPRAFWKLWEHSEEMFKNSTGQWVVASGSRNEKQGNVGRIEKVG